MADRFYDFVVRNIPVQLKVNCFRKAFMQRTIKNVFIRSSGGIKVEVALLSELEFKHQVTTARGEGGRRGMGA